MALRVDRAQVALPAAVRCHVGGRLAGKMVLLAVPAAGATRATVRLDGPLSAAGLDLAEEDAVRGYLARAMRFDVKKSDGTIVDTSSIPSLEITVVDRQVTPRRSDHEFPTYGVATRRPWTEEQ